MDYDVSVADRTLSIRVNAAKGGGYEVSVAQGPVRRIAAKAVGPAEWVFREGDRSTTMGVYVDGDVVHVSKGGHAWRVGVVDPRKAALSMGDTGEVGAIVTPMPGVIVRLLVAEGDTVTKGQPVLVVEAMKMENEFKAPCDGVIERIPVTAGQSVDSGALLAVITPEASHD